MRVAPLIASVVTIACIAYGMVEWSHRREIAESVTEFDSYDVRDGKKEAEADIARGNPKWKVCGLVHDSREDVARLKRLGIEFDWFQGCIVSEGILRYQYTYNSTVYSHFLKLAGEETTRDVLGDPPYDPNADFEEEG